MNHTAFERILELSSTEEALEHTVQYLTNQLKPIIRESEATLVCFPRSKETDFGYLVGKAIERCGGRPIFWEGDLRWITLLRMAFLSKASTIIATPLVLLGLSKLSKHMQTPLCLINVVMAGYPCTPWMMEGIEKYFDSTAGGILTLGMEAVVCGASCGHGHGIHIRQDRFGVCILDPEGNPLPDGQYGRTSIYPTENPDAAFSTRFFGKISQEKCSCGNPAPKIVDIDVGDSSQMPLLRIVDELLNWSSILDCRITRSDCGLELEIVCFQGEKLPKLPSFAKQIVRAWNPEADVPFSIYSGWTAP